MTNEADETTLQWKGDFAETSNGTYILSKSRIRHGNSYTTEWEVSIFGKLIGIAGLRADAKIIAQSHYNVGERNV